MIIRTRRFLLLVVALILATIVIPVHVSQAQTDLLVWAQVGGVPPTITLTDVQMLDQNTAWAVGNDTASGDTSGYVYRLSWSSGRWTVSQDARFDAPLNALHALDDSNIWAVGGNGLIVHRDSDGWKTVPSPISGSSILTLQMAGNGQEGWAGGSFQPEGQPQRALLLHYQNGTWRQETAPTQDGELIDVEINGSTIRAIVSGRVWRNSGGQWAAEPTP